MVGSRISTFAVRAVIDIRDRHIFPDQAQGFAVAVALAAENTVCEFLCLIPQPGFAQRPRCNADKVKNIAVLPDERAGRLFDARFGFL